MTPSYYDAAEILRIAREHGAEDVGAECIREQLTLSEALPRILRRTAARQLGGYPSLSRMIAQTVSGKLTGVDAAMQQEWQEAAGISVAPNLLLPFGFLFRDMTTLDGSGAYLTTSAATEARLALSPFSPVMRTSIQTVSIASGTATTMPQETARPNVQWFGEFDTPSGSTPTIAGRQVMPHLASASITLSRQLVLQSPNLDVYWRSTLRRAAAAAIDAAVLVGDGIKEPTGLVNVPGITTQSGSSLNVAGTTAMRDAIAAADGDDLGIIFVGHPSVRTTLSTRVATGSGGYVWANDRCADRRAEVSTQLSNTTLLGADFNEIVLVLFGPGVELQVTPTASREAFMAGQFTCRVLLSCDVICMTPAAVSVSSDVS